MSTDGALCGWCQLNDRALYVFWHVVFEGRLLVGEVHESRFAILLGEHLEPTKAVVRTPDIRRVARSGPVRSLCQTFAPIAVH